MSTFEELYRQVNTTEEPTEVRARIQYRRERLAQVAAELKEEFVGLDDVIDEVIRNIESWYVMPELCTRPVIVALWGMTGVGKTDLVRKLSRKLGFGDKFWEVQLSGGASSSSSYTIKSELGYSSIMPKEPGILLLDEIQRWRSVSENGGDSGNTKYQDIWMLLSDGKFDSRVTRHELFTVVYGEGLYYTPKEYKNGYKAETSEKDLEKARKLQKELENSVYHINYEEARRLKRIFKLDEDVLEIMKWTKEKRREVALSRINNQEVYAGDDYSKLLIFISGNLDEAYSMSTQVADADTDADVMYEFSKKINFLTIKRALRKRFRPEQISRFGNVHVIYPSMSRKSYQDLICKRLQNFAEHIMREHNIRVSFDSSINDFVYRNGVIPSQGVRPVFSTIASYVENACPRILLAAVEQEIGEVELFYDEESAGIYAMVGAERLEVPTVGKVDAIKKAKHFDSRALVSAHEAGHALLYALAFGVAPTQIISNVTSPFKDGFIGIHDVTLTRQSVSDVIAVLMAGRAAEEVVFGNHDCSIGAQADIKVATAYAARYIREWGFGQYTSYVLEKGKEGSERANTNEEVEVNDQIDAVCRQGLEEAKRILVENQKAYRAIVEQLYRNQEILPVDFKKLLAEHGISIRIVDAKETLYKNYSRDLERFLSCGGE